MLQNNAFSMYNKTTKTLVDGYLYHKNSFCEKCFNDGHKKCRRYYEKINVQNNEIITCPYGLTTIIYNGNIFTSIITNDNINKQTLSNFGNDIKNQIRFSKEQALELIKSTVERDEKLERYRETVHDLRNMASYFNAMIDEYLEDKEVELLSSKELSLISLYELINFRLDILYGKVDLTSTIEKEQKLHPIVLKMIHLLKYKARAKGINIDLSKKQDNYFNITKSLYLAIFILLENAIKYAIPNTTININFIESDKFSKIVIKNQTKQMNEKDGNILLQKGIRGSNADSLGSGIGLAFANELLENMGANLKIELSKKTNKSMFSSIITLENVTKRI